MARGQYPIVTAFNFKQRLKRFRLFTSSVENVVTTGAVISTIDGADTISMVAANWTTAKIGRAHV